MDQLRRLSHSQAAEGPPCRQPRDGGQAAFPSSVPYGDLTRGLRIKTASCDGVYVNNVLERLALADFYRALDETLKILHKGGLFRLIVANLQQLARDYLKAAEGAGANASHECMRNSYLSLTSRPKTLKEKLIAGAGNSDHPWMWERTSMQAALSAVGFIEIREARFGNSDEFGFSKVEDSARFERAIAFQAMK